ncbi:MAG TPA: malto-oligosyltrehalose synthase [Thermoanaerobaculia bacterium]|nr:malto-oligosyltrehalose synthase [Thermoanaerobaculia bacterium]
MDDEIRRPPLATYRLQFGPHFTLRDAVAIVPYLDRLGVTDLYASPLWKARSGSEHGYDVTDPTELNPEIGTEEDFDALCRELRGRGMGLLLDIVPNHLAASPENPWWNDVLEHGAESRYAGWFDIVWSSLPSGGGETKLLLPVLGQRYGEALGSHELRLELGASGFTLRYYDSAFPIALRSYPMILDQSGVASRGAKASREWRHFEGIIESIRKERDAPHWNEPATKRAIKRLLLRLYRTDAPARAIIGRCLARFNEEGDESAGLLDSLLDEQPYRLIYWRRAASDVNYRRFFDISDLVGVRVEIDEVFRAVHARLFEWISEEKVTAVRVDHVDGLLDPIDYLRKLQQSAASSWNGDPRRAPLHVVVEKILAPEERLHDSFAAAGTTGYDFLNRVNALFVDRKGLRSLFRIYRDFTGSEAGFEELCYRRKKQVIATLFKGDLRMLGQQLLEIAGTTRSFRYISPREVVQALMEVSASLAVYRTYTRDAVVREEDRRSIEEAIARARGRNPLDARIYDFLRSVLLLDPDEDDEDGAGMQQRLDFVLRWQQFTGPATAKGVEDTVLYGYNPLLSLSEVGGEVAVAGVDPAERFHRFSIERAKRWPHTMNATSTHDTKRSEDVRARIDVLSELPEQWEAALTRWSRRNRRLKRLVEEKEAPSRNEEVHLYQTLLGVWPLDPREISPLRRRVSDYLVKAVREAKTNSSWIEPNEDYERALVRFARTILRDDDSPFMRDFLRFQRRVAWYGAWNALAQTLLKMTSPGSPDFYQGTELWDFSMVDPDNRRAVDFRKRARIVRDLDRADDRLRLVRDVLKHWKDGRAKLFLIREVLRARRADRDLFLSGSYVPLKPSGAGKASLVGFARRHRDRFAIVAVPRMLTRLAPLGKLPLGAGVWGSTTLSIDREFPRRWHNVLTGGEVEAVGSAAKKLHAAEVFAEFPVALLIGIA